MLAPRYLLPAVPLECLYLVAAVPHDGAAGVQYTVALTAFGFVAAAFALSRIGRRSVERVLVDRRILVALVLASLAFFGRYAENSPYAGPWHWGRQDSADGARLQAVDLVGDDRAVRASPTLLPLLAERERVYELVPGDTPQGSRAGRGVTAVVLDERDPDWTPEQFDEFEADLEDEGFILISRSQRIAVFRKPFA